MLWNGLSMSQCVYSVVVFDIKINNRPKEFPVRPNTNIQYTQGCVFAVEFEGTEGTRIMKNERT